LTSLAVRPDVGGKQGLCGLLAAVPTVRSLCIRGPGHPPSAWLTGAVVLPALEALEYPVMDFSVAALGALAAQCPALRALDLRSAGSASVDMQREYYLTFDDARARSLAAFPTLEWLAVGTVAPTDAGWAAWAEAIGPDGYFVRGPNGVTLPGLTAAGVAALLDRPSAKPWRRLCVIFGNVPGCFGGAEAGFAGATGGLPTALELVGHLPVAAAVALAGLPAPVAASLTSLTVSSTMSRTWEAPLQETSVPPSSLLEHISTVNVRADLRGTSTAPLVSISRMPRLTCASAPTNEATAAAATATATSPHRHAPMVGGRAGARAAVRKSKLDCRRDCGTPLW